MRTLKESLLDKDFDIKSEDLLFDKFYNHPNVVEDDLRLRSNDELNDAIDELLLDNLLYVDDIDPDKLIYSVLSNRKFIRVVKKSKCTKGVYYDARPCADDDFVADMWETYSDFKNKRIGRLEFKKKLKDAFLSLEIYSFGEYYFVFLIGNDNVIYGFIACD